MHDKMCDSMRFLYTQDTCTFSQLLKEVMKAEAEHKSRSAVRVKAAQAEAGTSDKVANPEITSIQKQLDSMSQFLKSAQIKSKQGKSVKGQSAKSAEAKPKSKGPAVSAAGPFREGRPPVQCYRCMGWGHYKRGCPSREPVQGSVEWGNLHGEVAQEGAPLSRQEKEHPQTKN